MKGGLAAELPPAVHTAWREGWKPGWSYGALGLPLAVVALPR